MSHNTYTKRILIVGGGSAGWLTAGLLASQRRDWQVTLVESKHIATIGVGEGTWPTMRTTLQKIGINEDEFMHQCEASFKQGSEFINWAKSEGHRYYHPFSLPVGYTEQVDIVSPWLGIKDKVDFAHASCAQSYWCDRALAPKTASDPQYQGRANYGYHLNADKFAQLLKQHCTTKLGVTLILDDVISVNGATEGYISSVSTRDNGELAAELFVDCTGSRALLLGEHYGVQWLSKKHILKNDRAVALQVSHNTLQCEVASCTKSTAQAYGWIWDIALKSRRGIGYTFASEYCDFEKASKQLRQYINDQGLYVHQEAQVKEITFNPGYREQFWHKNCVAIGMSAGFIEPLEASALVMIELGAQYLCDNLPESDNMMDVVAQRYNDKFKYHWARIIDFLKLHYVLSERDDTPYWQSMKSDQVPQSLTNLMTLWRHRPPKHGDLDHIDEVFSSASYQYVLYGMGFNTLVDNPSITPHINSLFKQVTQVAQQGLDAQPTNRTLLDNIAKYGIAKV
ncbi:tryptophan halogenase family protein [Pseudoalteromonas sp. T1lg23B]|uniref:tryptophan halogenase family protein n=1 Tax=Pseudoalteromonas sp. T1lg23B TaxID=2077097 RepID=UPI000CF678BA|nr:tryptophan halogenase family protein [Pseudoalteromonas sp. T1lg23B]